MSYRPKLSSVGPFVVGYRDSAFTTNIAGTLIPFTHVIDSRTITQGSGLALNPGRLKIFSVGETRTSGGGQGENTCDIGIDNNSIKSEGYQVRNNAVGSVLCDDACYGITQDAEITIKLQQLGSSADLDSDAYQTRLMGVVTQ